MTLQKCDWTVSVIVLEQHEFWCSGHKHGEVRFFCDGYLNRYFDQNLNICWSPKLSMLNIVKSKLVWCYGVKQRKKGRLFMYFVAIQFRFWSRKTKKWKRISFLHCASNHKKQNQNRTCIPSLVLKSETEKWERTHQLLHLPAMQDRLDSLQPKHLRHLLKYLNTQVSISTCSKKN